MDERREHAVRRFSGFGIGDVSAPVAPASAVRRTPRYEPPIGEPDLADGHFRIQRMLERDGKRISGSMASFGEDVAARDDADVRKPFEPRFREIERVPFPHASEIDSGIRAEIFGSGYGGKFFSVENIAPLGKNRIRTVTPIRNRRFDSGVEIPVRPSPHAFAKMPEFDERPRHLQRFSDVRVRVPDLGSGEEAGKPGFETPDFAKKGIDGFRRFGKARPLANDGRDHDGSESPDFFPYRFHATGS